MDPNAFSRNGVLPSRGRKRSLFILTAAAVGLTLAILLVFAAPILAGDGAPPDRPARTWGPAQATESDRTDGLTQADRQEVTRADKSGRQVILLQGTISDGDVSLSIEPDIFEDNTDFEVPIGLDHLYQTWWWFRIAGDTEESPMPPPDGETYTGNTAVFTWTDVLTRGFDAYMVVTVSDDGDGAGSLSIDLTLTNTTGSALNIDLFAYTDFDLADSSIDDSAVLINPNDHIQIFKDGTVANYQGVGVQAYEVTTYSVLLDWLNDSSITNLANTGLPFAPDDFTGAFQWTTSIPAGGSETFQELISIQTPAIELQKTVGTDPSVCATTTAITVPIGTEVYYCYEVTNTGAVTLPVHDLVDSQFGTILAGFTYDLAPGASVDTVAAGLTISATITQTVVNIADWSAYNPGNSDYAMASAVATANALPGIALSKTVGLDPNACAPTDSLAINAPADVTYCYMVTNTTLIYTYTDHTLVDSRLGPILSGFVFPLTPGASVFLTQTASITETTVNQANWIAIGPDHATSEQDRALVSLLPSISLTKTVGMDPGVCATTDSVNANSAMPVTYCYEVTNTGIFTLPLHNLEDSALGTILADFAFPLAPGASVFLTQTASVNQTTVNTATWTASLEQDSTIDPMGDAFGFGPVFHDITTFTVSSDPMTLTITVAFSDTISPGDSGQPDAVVGYLDIDADENPLTGADSFAETICPTRTNLGTDYFVDMFSYSSFNNDALVIDIATFSIAGFADVTFTMNSFTVEVSLADLGGDDGLVDVATVLGTIPEPTDCAPNGGSISNNPTSAVATDTATVNSYPLYMPIVNKN